MGSSTHHRDKMHRQGMETPQFSMIRKVQDHEVCWQSDGYIVLGPLRCTRHTNQYSVIFCNTDMFTPGH
jgi:hypothetical protein